MKTNRYEKIILDIFERKYSGQEEFEFERSDLVESCARLGIDPPKNLGDVIYAFRYRSALPQPILVRPLGVQMLSNKSFKETLVDLDLIKQLSNFSRYP